MNGFPEIAMVIVAAGQGTRLGGVPKQYRLLAGKPLLAHALAHAGVNGHVARLVTVIRPEAEGAYRDAATASGIAPDRLAFAHGGETRQASVRNGLESLAKAGFGTEAIVLIHDAARPFLPEATLLALAIAAARNGAAIPVLPVADTLAQLDSAGNLTGTIDRAKARIVQTPQAFRFGMILDAHRKAAAEKRDDFTDDASLAAAYGQIVASVPGDAALFKVTEAADFARAERHLGAGAEIRTGLGYDVHAFDDGDHLWLGGVKIAHSRKLSGHSDADPVLHALTDALLGTIGDGDIGMHFPPSDPQWKGAPSHLFLADAMRRVVARGGRIVSVDCTVICERPKIGPHRVAMQAAIGAVLGLGPDRIGIKATTSEKLGFTGREEGIAAMAVASVAF